MANQTVTREDIEAAAERVGGVIEAMADSLSVPLRWLRERIRVEKMDLERYRSVPGPRTWAECRGEQCRQQLLADTLETTSGNRTHAARLLQMSRQHLQDVLAKYARMVEAVRPTDSTTAGDTDKPVVPTVLPALTYWLPGPSFHRVDTVDAVETATMTFAPPKHLKDWLERKALDRKQSSGGRFAVSPVIVEILERARAAEEQ